MLDLQENINTYIVSQNTPKSCQIPSAQDMLIQVNIDHDHRVL